MTSRFRRKLGERRYKRMFVIVAEGTHTEREYFRLFHDEMVLRVHCLKNHSGLPPLAVLARIRRYKAKEGLRKGDEIWAVLDRDSWDENHIREVHHWSQSNSSHGLALSNPKFEYWLLLHFEDCKGVRTASKCDERLSRHLPNYEKHVDARKFTLDRIEVAVSRGKDRDSPPCADWPRKPGSTVYKLVEKILKARSD